jgi:hypothetical protein
MAFPLNVQASCQKLLFLSVAILLSTAYQNPDDLQYIAKMVPYVNQGMIDRLTYLQTGHALVFGTAINLPTLTKFEQASPKPVLGQC